jgi:hypothetical protein
MLNRRTFIRDSIAGTVGAVLLTDTLAAATVAMPVAGTPQRKPQVPLYAAVLDARFAHAEQFGAALAPHGIPTRTIRGDVTDLWYSELQLRWRERAVPIAGLTSYSALFCLEQLARDQWMRVIYRGIHRRLSDGRVEHVLSGAQVASVRDADNAAWPLAIATLIAQIDPAAPAGAAAATRARYLTPATPIAEELQEPLYSWVIGRPLTV